VCHQNCTLSFTKPINPIQVPTQKQNPLKNPKFPGFPPISLLLQWKGAMQMKERRRGERKRRDRDRHGERERERKRCLEWQQWRIKL